MMWIELLILFTCIVIGARLGGIGLGTMGGIGLVVLVFVFGLPPGSPPGIVLGMIIAVITALASMQSAGGLDYLISFANKVLRKKPQYITFVAPFVTYVLIAASGTQHVIYALLPVIAEVSTKAGVRPERPLSISVTASMYGLISSPISAATVALLAALVSYDVNLLQIMMVIIPASLLGLIVGILSVAWKGKELKDDPEYQERLKTGKIQETTASVEIAKEKITNARNSLFVFLCAIVVVVMIGIFPQLRPDYKIFSAGESITLNKYDLTLKDIFSRLTDLKHKVIAGLSESNIDTSFVNAENEIELIFDRIKENLFAVDKTLVDSSDKYKDRVIYVLNELRNKAVKAQENKHETTVRQLTRISHLLYPNENLQEREINFTYFFNKYGIELIKKIFEEISVNEFEHQIIIL